jgi:hypothetical protein
MTRAQRLIGDGDRPRIEPLVTRESWPLDRQRGRWRECFALHRPFALQALPSGANLTFDPARQSNALLTHGSISDVVRPRPALGGDAVALIVSAATGGVISTLRARCHFYLAPTTPALSDML